MTDELLPMSTQVRIEQIYARNPLFQQDSSDVLRATQLAGLGGNSDGTMLARNNAEATASQLGRQHEEALLPFLESLRLAQGDPMYQAISAQMDNLYQVFKELHNHDQQEIRKLLLTLEAQQQQLQQLTTENDNVRQQLRSRERELAAATVAAAAARQLTREQQLAVAAVGATAAVPPPLVSASLDMLGRGTAGAVAAAAAGRNQRLNLRAGLNNQPAGATAADGAMLAEAALAAAESSETAAADGTSRAGGSFGGSPGAPGARGPLPSAVMQQRMGGSRFGTAGMGVRISAMEGVGAGGGGGGVGGGGRERSVSKRGRRPYFIIFLPYMLHPAHQCWRFYAAWQYSWTTRRTLWLAMAWVLVFLLAVGLLVGLLVPWDKLGRTTFTAGPEVVAVGAEYVSLRMQLNKAAAVYYVVVPEAVTTAATAAAAAGAAGGAASGNGGGAQPERRRRIVWAATSVANPRAPAEAIPGNSATSGCSGSSDGGVGGLTSMSFHQQTPEPYLKHDHHRNHHGGDVSTGSWQQGLLTWWWSPAAGYGTRAFRGNSGGGAGGGGGHHRRLMATGDALRLDGVAANDVVDMAEGSAAPGAALFNFAVACGQVDVHLKDTNYTLTVRSGVPTGVAAAGGPGAGAAPGTGGASVDECTTSFGMALNGTLPSAGGPFYARRCQRCPFLQPGTPYVALFIGDGGRRTGVVQVRFTITTSTAATPRGGSLTASSSPPPLPLPPPPMV